MPVYNIGLYLTVINKWFNINSSRILCFVYNVTYISRMIENLRRNSFLMTIYRVQGGFKHGKFNKN